jgi:hypothetical protein
MTYGGSAGLLYLFTRNVGLDASVFYRLTRASSEAPSGVSNRFFGVSVGFSAFAY